MKEIILKTVERLFFVIRQILTNFAKVKQKIVSIFSDPGDIAIDSI